MVRNPFRAVGVSPFLTFHRCFGQLGSALTVGNGQQVDNPYHRIEFFAEDGDDLAVEPG